MRTIIKLNPMYYFVEFFRHVTYRRSAHMAEAAALVAEGKAVPADVVAATQLSVFTQTLAGDLCVLYSIGLITTLIGAIVFMSTKRKFIYNI